MLKITYGFTHLARSATIATSVILGGLTGQEKQGKAGPVFKNGQAQVVEAFSDRSQWIQHDLWVETEFDTDGDNKADRVHVDVTRPLQTKTEGLKVPVIYESSPYYSGTSSTNRRYFWDPKQEVGAEPPDRPNPGLNRPGSETASSSDIAPQPRRGGWMTRVSVLFLSFFFF